MPFACRRNDCGCHRRGAHHAASPALACGGCLRCQLRGLYACGDNGLHVLARTIHPGDFAFHFQWNHSRGWDPAEGPAEIEHLVGTVNDYPWDDWVVGSARLLLEENMWGETPLHIAAGRDVLGPIAGGLPREFFNARVFAGLRRADGLTPLHVALLNDSDAAIRFIVGTAESWEDAWALLYANAAPPSVPQWPSVATLFAQLRLKELATAAEAAEGAANQAAAGFAGAIVVGPRPPPQAPTAFALRRAADAANTASARAEAAATAAAGRTPLALACAARPRPCGKGSQIRTIQKALGKLVYPIGEDGIHFAARGALLELLKLIPRTGNAFSERCEATNGPDEVRRPPANAKGQKQRHRL